MSFHVIKESAVQLYDNLHAVQLDYFNLWKNHMVFTLRWWMSLSLIIFPWTLWFILRKKDSTYRLLLAGFFVAIISSFLDMLGVTLRLWTYPITVLPLMPSYLPFDLSSMPVATMLWLQFFPKMKLLYKTLIYAAVGGFFFEPICENVGLVIEEGWNYFFSFLIMIVIYLLAYFFSTRDQFDKI